MSESASSVKLCHKYHNSFLATSFSCSNEFNKNNNEIQNNFQDNHVNNMNVENVNNVLQGNDTDVVKHEMFRLFKI